MKRISIKMKIMIWFTAAMIIMVVGTSAVNFFISRQVLDQSIQERLLDTVSSNAQEIEYRSSVSGEREAQDFSSPITEASSRLTTIFKLQRRYIHRSRRFGQ